MPECEKLLWIRVLLFMGMSSESKLSYVDLVCATRDRIVWLHVQAGIISAKRMSFVVHFKFQ